MKYDTRKKSQILVTPAPIDESLTILLNMLDIVRSVEFCSTEKYIFHSREARSKFYTSDMSLSV